MLESHHALVVKALQQLYTHCINNKCFPGEPLDVVDGYPLTHAILDRLGLIKEAEKELEDSDSTSFELLQLWEEQRSAENSVGTDELSPGSSTGIPSSSSSVEPPSPDKASLSSIKCEHPSAVPHSDYRPYRCDDPAWLLDGQPETTTIDHGIGAADYYTERIPVPSHATQHSHPTGPQPREGPAQEHQDPMSVPGGFSQPESHTAYGIQHLPYHRIQGNFEHIGQHYSWNSEPWSR